MMRTSQSRGVLYSAPPDYDVFKRPTRDAKNVRTDADGPAEAETPSRTPEPVMGRANWTGTVPADD